MAKCSFCGGQVIRSMGHLFVKRDGTAMWFCSKKCKINMLELKRSPFTVKWTEFYQKEKQANKQAVSGKEQQQRSAPRKGKKKRK